MADILCGYTADRDETLIAFLYGDIEPAQRAAFEAHIATCDRCRHEVAELQDVRERLQEWTLDEEEAPEAARPLVAIGSLAGSSRVPAPSVESHEPPRRRRSTLLADLPLWAQLAAATLVLGVSSGIAGLEVHYDGSGLTVRTGWSRPASPPIPPAASPAGSAVAATNPDAASPWKADFDALERRMKTELRAELHASSSAASAVPARTEGSTVADAALLRKVRALVDESERRQRNELALRIAEIVQEFDTKRGTDLANVRSMKTIQSATGVEIVRQQQWLDLLTKASMQR